MPPPFKVSVVTPTGVLFEGDAEMVIAVGALGEFGVLADHVNFVTSLAPCVLEIRTSAGEPQRWIISGGIAEVKDGEMTVLANDTQLPSQVDLESAQAAEREADHKLATMSTYDPDYGDIDEALKLARVRIRVASAPQAQ
jgi:F-type H+-transporting ATPase subunit epsilon